MANLRNSSKSGGSLIITYSNLLNMIQTLDGHGSGIDADMLDGRHGSEFSVVGHTHSDYVKKIGDTMSGDLVFDTSANVVMKVEDRNGGWIRGTSYKKAGIVVGGMGLLGSGSNITCMYMGLGDEPYGFDALRVLSDRCTFKNNTVVHSGMYGHGGGINADMLDGKHLSELSAAIGEQYYLKTGGDITGGVNIKSGGNCLNLMAKTVDHVYISFFARQNSDTRSGYIGYGSNGETNLTINNEIPEGEIRFRAKDIKFHNYKIVHEGLYGHNKGINADMIDNRHYSDIENSFVKKVGDTMTGTLNIEGASGELWLRSKVNGKTNSIYRFIANQDGNCYMQIGIDDNNSNGYFTISGLGAKRLKAMSFGCEFNSFSINGYQIHSDNDNGHGGRIDADKLDGKHATDFSLVGHNHDTVYVKKSGDAMSGQLRFGSGTNSGTMFGNIKFDAVTNTILALRNLEELRFGSTDTWGYTQWAGIKYDTPNKILYIGGPGGVFSKNGQSDNIRLNLTNGVNQLDLPEKVVLNKEGESAKLSQVFKQATTFKSELLLTKKDNKHGKIIHETGNTSEPTKSVLHLCPTDVNTADGYVSVHGHTQNEAIKMYTSGGIDMTGRLQIMCGSNDIPIYVASTTACTNLNADMLDGKHYTDLVNTFVRKSGDTMGGPLNFDTKAGAKLFIYKDGTGSERGDLTIDISSSNQARFRLGGTGVVPQNGFAFQGPSDVELMKLSSDGLLTIKRGGRVLTVGDYGHGRGINADMLDDLHKEDFIYGRLGTGTNTVTDFNGVWKSGFYECNNLKGDGIGIPANERTWFWMLHAGHTSNREDYRYGLQIATPYTQNRFYIRNKNANGEGNWNTLFHSGLNGHNGGIDADKLDGKHLSDIMGEIGDVVDKSQVTKIGYSLGNFDWGKYIELQSASQGTIKYNANEQGMELTTKIVDTACWCKVKIPIPVSDDAVYQVKIVVKQTQGDGIFLCGINSLDKDGNTLTTDKANQYNYGTANSPLVTGNVTTFSGIYKGYNATTDSNTNKFDPYASFFEVIFLTNHKNTQISKTVIKHIEVTRIAADTYSKTNIISFGEKNITNTQRINIDGVIYANKVFTSVYNDYAEYFEKNDVIEPGDVVELDINSDEEVYVKTTERNSKFVVGVCSDEFAHCIGGEGKNDDNENFSPIGLAGRVRVKVKGTVKKGDLLTSSDIPGVAEACKDYMPGTIIGKALENKNTEEISRVRMLIQLH